MDDPICYDEAGHERIIRSLRRALAAAQQHANEPAWAFEGDEWVPLVEDTALSQITPRK